MEEIHLEADRSQHWGLRHGPHHQTLPPECFRKVPNLCPTEPQFPWKQAYMQSVS